MYFELLWILIVSVSFSFAGELSGAVSARAVKAAKCYHSAPDALCNKKGKLQKPSKQPISGETGGPASGPATSLVHCRARCYQYGVDCGSLSWNSDSGYCRLYGKKLEDQKYVAGNSTAVFYDAACFDCLDTCPRPLDENLLVNGGFEQFQKSINPWLSLQNHFKVVQPGHKSSQAVVFPNNPEGGNVEQHVFLCKSETYIAQFDYKVAPSANKTRQELVLIVFSNAASVLYTNDAPRGKWQSVRILGTGNRNSAFNFQVYGGSARPVVSIDNVKLRRVKSPHVSPSVPNLLVDEGFEKSTLRNWGDPKHCTVVSPGLHSKSAAKCHTGFDYSLPRITLRQRVKTVADTPYMLSFDYMPARAQNAGSFCSFSVGFDDQTFFGRTVSKNHNAGNGTWSNYEVAVLVPTKSVQVRIATYGIACDMYVDNVSFKKASIH